MFYLLTLKYIRYKNTENVFFFNESKKKLT